MLRVLTLTVLSLFSVTSVSCSSVKYQNNVCKTFKDYATLTSNPNCWYNSDADSNPRLIAKKYGYHFEKHKVRTEDGFILNVYRISSNNTFQQSKKQPILMHHGVGGVSAFWILQGNKSVAFFLADSGYDVWLSNARGTYYSPQHEKYSTADPEFWNFGFHEIGIYDLPATIDYIANTTGQKGNILYAGHSMGTTVALIYSAVCNQHAKENLRGFILLAPVGHMAHIKGALKDLSGLEPQLAPLFKMIGLHVFAQFHQFQKNILRATCGTYPLILVCNLLMTYGAGFAPKQMQPALLPVFFGYYPSAISVKLVQHYAQIMNNGGNFRQYNYGHQQNMKLYQQSEPPEYDMKSVSVPMYFFVGTKDVIANEKDVDFLITQINGSNKNIDIAKYTFDYAHNDFFVAKEVLPFYEVLLSTLKTKLQPM